MGTITINKNDSMKTIQNKLNSASGNTVVFTKATYKITKQLIIPKDTKIDLNGARLQRKASIQSIFINKVTPDTTCWDGDGNIIIKNGIFEGMGGYSYDNLVTFFHSHHVTIENCVFQDILCHGIELNSTYICIVKSCKFLGYNLKDADNAYKEMIQIDQAGYSGFVLNGSTRYSKCYDGTCCEGITVINCTFDKSNTRDYPYACIGAHAQMYNVNKKHEHIRIFNNTFHCKINKDIVQACISIINMKNVEIQQNIFDCARVARIYSKTSSYTLDGKKVTPHEGDGLCNGVSIFNNIIYNCKNAKAAFQQYNKSSKTHDHTGISKTKNEYCAKID